MTIRRRLKADYNLIETNRGVKFLYDAHVHLGAITSNDGDRWNHISLTEDDLDAIYEALKQREAHKQFLANKYGANA